VLWLGVLRVGADREGGENLRKARDNKGNHDSLNPGRRDRDALPMAMLDASDRCAMEARREGPNWVGWRSVGGRGGCELTQQNQKKKTLHDWARASWCTWRTKRLVEEYEK